MVGAYLCTGGLIYLIGLLLVARPSRRLVVYSLVSMGTAGLGLIAFAAVSVGAGLMRFGQRQNWSYPGDYLAHGPVGWIIMLVPTLGLLSPLLVAIWVSRWRQAESG